MNAREEILARARAALAASPPTPPELPLRGPRDYRRAGTTDLAQLLAQLAERMADYRAGVHRVDLAGLPAALAGLLPGPVVVPADLPAAWLADCPGPVQRDLQPGPVPVAGLAEPRLSVLTGCAVAIAETGTIVLDAGPAQGRRALTLVPDHHVCVVAADQVVATVPEGLARLTDPTRPLTLISGPSATSDIELNRVEGVHGPRHLDVVVLSPPA